MAERYKPRVSIGGLTRCPFLRIADFETRYCRLEDSRRSISTCFEIREEERIGPVGQQGQGPRISFAMRRTASIIRGQGTCLAGRVLGDARNERALLPVAKRDGRAGEERLDARAVVCERAAEAGGGQPVDERRERLGDRQAARAGAMRRGSIECDRGTVRIDNLCGVEGSD